MNQGPGKANQGPSKEETQALADRIDAAARRAAVDRDPVPDTSPIPPGYDGSPERSYRAEYGLRVAGILNEAYHEAKNDVEAYVAPGRYRSLAITALEESLLWLSRALEVDGPQLPDGPSFAVIDRDAMGPQPVSPAAPGQEGNP